MMMTKFFSAMLVVLGTACVIDSGEEPGEPPPDDDASDPIYKLGANKLGANKLGANKLGANKLGANKLGANALATTDMMASADSREVFSYIVGCAIPSGSSIVAKNAAGVSYTFPGALGLAPAWATRTPTVTERRWVSACVLARTNLYGVSVSISLRHDTNVALATSLDERTQYTAVEGAFFGDIFATPQAIYACGNRTWSAVGTNSLRMCALSQSGTVGSTTDCGFTYAGRCATACLDTTAPFGTCRGGGVTFAEAITINLLPSQVQ
jgi:hypothetical protein